MKDSIFKKLLHNAENYKIVSTGQEIMKGYKPDAMLQYGNNYIILECDTNTTRKGYIGGMIKAAKFLTAEKKGVVVLIIKEKVNTTVNQIHAHLQQYFEWIEPITNLQAVYLISTDSYCNTDTPLKLLDAEFIKYAKSIVRVVK